MLIAIIGLPGSGKTTLAEKLVSEFSHFYSVDWFNADVVRKRTNNWDFSIEGRIKQAKVLVDMITESSANIQIVDFVCPLKLQFDLINPCYSIWMNTISSSRYPDTDALFEKPKTDLVITNWNYSLNDIVTCITTSSLSLKR